MKKLFSFLIFLLVSAVCLSADEPVISPDKTVRFAVKDGQELYFDLYKAQAGSETKFNGKDKPTVMFLFGGGFIMGKRDEKSYLPWFKDLTSQGYNVVSIDYRLGLKGVKNVGVGNVKAIDKAIHMAVEDAFDATRYIIDHVSELDIDPRNIVISGSSAGAITSLQAEYELCNRTSYAKVLPPDFNYAGVVSYAGAILSMKGSLKFKEDPCPILLLHGTKDTVVKYTSIRFLNMGFFGSHVIARRLAKFGHVYDILRFEGHEHEIAAEMYSTQLYLTQFIQTNVIEKQKVVIDMTVDDPRVKFPKTRLTLKKLYD